MKPVETPTFEPSSHHSSTVLDRAPLGPRYTVYKTLSQQSRPFGTTTLRFLTTTCYLGHRENTTSHRPEPMRKQTVGICWKSVEKLLQPPAPKGRFKREDRTVEPNALHSFQPKHRSTSASFARLGLPGGNKAGGAYLGPGTYGFLAMVQDGPRAILTNSAPFESEGRKTGTLSIISLDSRGAV